MKPRIQDVIKERPEPWGYQGLYIFDDDGEVVAKATPTKSRTNAPLIAAAPELLYWLKIEHKNEKHKYCSACDVIAKAEGLQ